MGETSLTRAITLAGMGIQLINSSGGVSYTDYFSVTLSRRDLEIAMNNCPAEDKADLIYMYAILTAESIANSLPYAEDTKVLRKFSSLILTYTLNVELQGVMGMYYYPNGDFKLVTKARE